MPIPVQQSKMGPTVTIVGAGLAGLCAGFELQKAGYEVTILEARTQPGGRVRTLRVPFADGMYGEAGAMSFPDNATLVHKYVHQFDLALQPFLGVHSTDAALAYLKGVLLRLTPGAKVNWPVPLTPEEQALPLSGIVQKYQSPPVGVTVGNPLQAGWPPPGLLGLDQLSIVQYAQSKGASPGAVELIRTMTLAALDGEGPDHLSAFIMLRSRALLDSAKGFHAIQGGNDLLPKAFADRLLHHIQYGSAVFKVEHQDNGTVRAWFKQGGNTGFVDSDKLIFAIPYTVLRGIEAAPAFSAEKQAVINALESTAVTRIFMQFSERFWEKEHFSGLATTDLSIMTVMSAFQRSGKRGILECYSAGDNARGLAKMDDDQLLIYALNELKQVYPEAPLYFEGGTVQAWERDPYARGAYAFWEPGQYTRFAPALAAPEGSIHFAGDQTSVLPGWMEGALLSGVRAANEIQES